MAKTREVKKEKEVKEWTIMFYFASDNPLAPGVVSQLKAIKEAGFHPQANVIAQFDPHAKRTPSHIFEVNLVNRLKARNKPQVGFTSNDPFVRNLAFDKLWLEKDAETKKLISDSLNEGKAEDKKIVYDPPTPLDDTDGEKNPMEALQEFLRFCKDEYPARRYMLFVLGHGLIVGNDLFLFDKDAPELRNPLPVVGASKAKGKGKSNGDTSDKTTNGKHGRNSLLLIDLGTVLQGFKQSIGDSSFELVGFHSCSMSGLEVAYQIKESANFMMGSQGPAFVGSWPYRQILIRVFNDLNSEKFRDKHLIDVEGLVSRLIHQPDEISKDIYPRLAKSTRKLLEQPKNTKRYDKKLFDAMVKELNNLLYDTDPKKDAWVTHIKKLSPETKRLMGKQLKGMDRIWLNRLLLQDAFKVEIKKKKRRKIDVKKMLVRVFNYCMRNSYDFQMAGYSYDMCLSDLGKLRGRANALKKPLRELSAALKNGLKDKHTRKLILLAHLESQSYWQEQYTDLYDFCFRFSEAFNDAYTGSEEELADGSYKDIPPYAKPGLKKTPERIRDACEDVKYVLRRGVKSADDELIVRCKFVGPTYQYSHGFSVFFPWSRPSSDFFSEQYKNYAFSETGWDQFLEAYFETTMRGLRVKEVDMTDRGIIGDSGDPENADFDRTSDLERSVIEKVAGIIFNSDGQLSKGGSGDKTGDDCECPSIKNYPAFNSTDTPPDYEKGNPFPVSSDLQIQQS